MKRYLWIIGILLFASCTDFFDLGEETLDVPEPTKFTYVRFQNLGTYDVSVYDNYTRSPHNKVDEIGANKTSSRQKWMGAVNTGVQFYLTYHLPLTPDYSILYDPPPAIAVVEELIARHVTNTISIRPLNMPGDQPLFNDGVYLIIRNNDISSFRLMYNTGPMQPEGSRDALVRSGTTGVYKVPQGLVSYYNLAITTTNFPMPAEVEPSFQNGYCYSLVFDGSTVSLTKETAAAPITLNNINANVW